MILILSLIIIVLEAGGEGIWKRFSLPDFIFKLWLQWLIAIFLFGLWFIIAYHFDGYYVPTWKLIVGFIFVRFAIFDITYNLANGQKWNYYGTTKLYDRIMIKLGSWGWFMKGVCLIIGVVFLLGWS